MDGLGLGLPGEEALARQQLPEDDGRRVGVREPAHRLTASLLGRHVGELALHGAVARGVEAACGLGDAEVDEPCDAVDADEDVLRRHVAVHHVERLAALVSRFVGRVQPVQRVDHDRRGDCARGSARLAAAAVRARFQSDSPCT